MWVHIQWTSPQVAVYVRSMLHKGRRPTKLLCALWPRFADFLKGFIYFWLTFDFTTTILFLSPSCAMSQCSIRARGIVVNIWTHMVPYTKYYYSNAGSAITSFPIAGCVFLPPTHSSHGWVGRLTMCPTMIRFLSLQGGLNNHMCPVSCGRGSVSTVLRRCSETHHVGKYCTQPPSHEWSWCACELVITETSGSLGRNQQRKCTWNRLEGQDKQKF